MGLLPMELGFSLIWLGPEDASLVFGTKTIAGHWRHFDGQLVGGANNTKQS